MGNSKSKRLTRENLLRSSEFWIENIRTELYNMVQEYMDENDLSRKDLADELGVSKGYISQILNGNSDHRISKLASLATSLGKAPYVFLKDLETVIEEDKSDINIYIDFEELEYKAERCDYLDRVSSEKTEWNFNSLRNSNLPFDYLDIKATWPSYWAVEEEQWSSSVIIKPEINDESINSFEENSLADAA